MAPTKAGRAEEVAVGYWGKRFLGSSSGKGTWIISPQTPAVTSSDHSTVVGVNYVYVPDSLKIV